MMKLIKTSLSGCYIIQLDKTDDSRGSFVKTYHEPSFMDLGLETSFPEEYYSVSKKGILRGLHFQVPPYDHVKIVHCTVGKVIDAVVDLRIGSPTFGEHALFDLSEEKANMLYIPRGLAHGFYTMSEPAVMMYKVSTVYAPEYDSGILWSSAGISWSDPEPVISERDAILPTMNEFKTPFKYLDTRK